jgi:hypothetical protein
MRVLKARTFARWARREGLTDTALRTAVDEMRRGLVDAVLGGGLVKKRIARSGGGKSGGYRTLLAADLRDRWIFLCGFAKSERGNVDESELRFWRKLAQAHLAMSEEIIERSIAAGELIEVERDEQETA